jgi:predicted Zn-ribbon and HTH transcriptional regulator
MNKIIINLEPTLPSTEKAMRARVEELQNAITTLQGHLRLLIGTGMSIGIAPYHRCVRCGNEWQKKRYTYVRPVTCPQCNSRYWDKPRIYAKVKRVKVTEQTHAEQLASPAMVDAFFLPPPPKPLSLKERMEQVKPYLEIAHSQQQPEVLSAVPADPVPVETSEETLVATQDEEVSAT